MELVAGIDPGANGSITLLDLTGKPFDQMLHDKSTDRDIVDWLMEFRDDIKLAYIEEVHAMKGQGVSSMFKFGHSYGKSIGIVMGLKIKLEYVTPQAWQKELGVPKCEKKDKKKATKAKAQDLFPNLKITHATADSMLIAEYARRQYNRNRGVSQ